MLFRSKDVLSREDLSMKECQQVHVVIDRVKVSFTDDAKSRFGDSVQMAFSEGDGECIIKALQEEEIIEKAFSNKFELDGMEFEEPSEHMFSFNNPIGACPRCEGYGKIIGIDEDLVIPNKSLSVYERAVACWRGEKMQEWKNLLVMNAGKFKFPIHKPYNQLTTKQKELLWTGNKHFYGLNDFFDYLERKKYKIQYRVMLSRYRGKTVCPECKGTRLKKEASYVKVGEKSIPELVLMPIDKVSKFFSNL